MNRISSVNYLSGIAVLIVMIHHIFFVYNARWSAIRDILKFPDRDSQLVILEIAGFVSGYFGVAIFLLISILLYISCIAQLKRNSMNMEKFTL